MDEIVTGVGVVDKAVALLRAVEGGARTLHDLVAVTGLSRPTAHRLAAALVQHGLLRRDDDHRYLPGLRLIALGRAASQTLPLADAARVPLQRLRDATGESAQLYVRDGEGRVCVAVAESPHGLRTIVPLGAVLDLHRGSAGRVLLGDAATLAQGWAESVAEREPGVASVSAPVLQDGRVVAAVSVSGPVDRTGREPGQRYAAAVIAAARAVETAAGLR
ncbi:MAG: IclR family transcriptional regulator [Acidimicrobiales bacterium]|nr:IclR family transcriptional regulator [Acidimicrobiales bacterium]